MTVTGNSYKQLKSVTGGTACKLLMTLKHFPKNITKLIDKLFKKHFEHYVKQLSPKDVILFSFLNKSRTLFASVQTGQLQWFDQAPPTTLTLLFTY